jgi:electron transfer flavoprotein beta subunit
VLTGRESGDWGDGQTGGLLAEELGLPCVSFTDQLEATTAVPPVIRARRQTDDGWEMIEAAGPIVATITNNDQNVPRVAKTRDVMQAFRQPLLKLTLADLGLDAAALAESGSASEVVELSIPKKETKCEFVTGDTIQDRVVGLAQKIAAVMQSA